jgi:uncharacterized membrane protein
MEPVLIEWGNLLLRWLHIIAAIAWIGSSFYFMHLDASLRAPPGRDRGVDGEAWEVHGGGFYEVRKYLVAPDHLPKELMWHKWEAYTTWLSGFFLLVWAYYLRPDLFLVDPAVLDVSPAIAVAIGICALAAGWIVYDLLCKSALGRNAVALAAIGFLFIIAMAAFFQHVFSPRAAFIHTGALMATIMAANVFFVIIPNQTKVVAALKAGRTPDPILGAIGKQRSAHNNYLTLPVVFLMISNHYPMTYSSPYAFVVVGLMLVAGAVVRVFYNERHAGNGDKWWTWIVAAGCVLLTIVISMTTAPGAREALGLAPLVPAQAYASASAAVAAPPDEVVDIVMSRCSMCHAAVPAWNGIAIAPKGVLLDSPQAIVHHAEEIYMEAVFTHAMPPNNITQLSDADRQVLRNWLAPSHPASAGHG